MYKYKVVYNIKIGILLFMTFSVKQTTPRENRKKNFKTHFLKKGCNNLFEIQDSNAHIYVV